MPVGPNNGQGYQITENIAGKTLARFVMPISNLSMMVSRYAVKVWTGNLIIEFM
jgi:hypothetical protein